MVEAAAVSHLYSDSTPSVLRSSQLRWQKCVLWRCCWRRPECSQSGQWLTVQALYLSEAKQNFIQPSLSPYIIEDAQLILRELATLRIRQPWVKISSLLFTLLRKIYPMSYILNFLFRKWQKQYLPQDFVMRNCMTFLRYTVPYQHIYIFNWINKFVYKLSHQNIIDLKLFIEYI